MSIAVATFSVKAFEYVYKNMNDFINLGGDIDVNRRIRIVSHNLRKYNIKLYDQSSTLLKFNIRILNVEVPETTLYGCVKGRPRFCPCNTLRRAQRPCNGTNRIERTVILRGNLGCIGVGNLFCV